MKKETTNRQNQNNTNDVISRVFGNQDQKISSESENVSLIIKEWLDPKHIKSKTRYTKKQVVAVSILQSLAETYNIKTLKRFLNEFKTVKLSEDGQSSSELENILKSRIPDEQDVELRKLSKFLE
jgi:hypothetical protein